MEIEKIHLSLPVSCGWREWLVSTLLIVGVGLLSCDDSKDQDDDPDEERKDKGQVETCHEGLDLYIHGGCPA